MAASAIVDRSMLEVPPRLLTTNTTFMPVKIIDNTSIASFKFKVISSSQVLKLLLLMYSRRRQDQKQG